jgi:ferredoxin
MADVDITFEREGLSGVVAAGTYLADALRRFGLRPEFECDAPSGLHYCEVEVRTGESLLSPLTPLESEHFASGPRKAGQRLACQARIEKPGEIVVMTKEKKEEAPKNETRSEQYRKEFTELPLEEKISELVRLEAIALGDTFSFILNSPLKIFAKVGDVMADLGKKLENQAKQAARPTVHTADAKAGNGSSEAGPRKGGSKKKSAKNSEQ